MTVNGQPLTPLGGADVGAGKVVGSVGAVGDADGAEGMLPDGALDDDHSGDGEGPVAQAATKTTDRTSNAVDRTIQGASETRETCEFDACYEGPSERSALRALCRSEAAPRMSIAARQTLRSNMSRAGVTQLAECLLPKQNVAGSNPVSRSSPLDPSLWRHP